MTYGVATIQGSCSVTHFTTAFPFRCFFGTKLPPFPSSLPPRRDCGSKPEIVEPTNGTVPPWRGMGRILLVL